MNDVERGLHREGPEPQEIEELLEAARRDRRLTPERSARMKRKIDEALAARLREPSRRRTTTWAAAGVLLAAAVAIVAVVVAPAALVAVRSTTPGTPPPPAPMVMVATAEPITDSEGPPRPATDAGAPRAPAPTPSAPRRPGRPGRPGRPPGGNLSGPAGR